MDGVVSPSPPSHLQMEPTGVLREHLPLCPPPSVTFSARVHARILAFHIGCYNFIIQQEGKMSPDGSEITRVARSKDSARKTYNRLSKWYDLLAGSSERKFTEVGLQKLNVQDGEKILEIGFGTGHSLLTLARQVGTMGKVYGIDLSEGMLQVASDRLSKSGMSNRVELHCGDATRLPFPDQFFDAVFMSFVLELFDTPELPLVMRECQRVLNGTGRVGIVVLSKKESTTVRLYEWFHLRFPAYVDCRPIYARQTMEAAGFRVVDMTEMVMWGLPVEVIIAKKGN
jgi:ubiquinone/menaquinone biosynthesis C-methylase UbiE